MCLIAIAVAPTPDLRLVVAANRDEFHDRPSSPACWWPDAPDVLGGRDLRAGGSWLALRRDGRFAAVTNVRRMEASAPGARSRGALVRDFVTGDVDATTFAERLAAQATRHGGFNLLAYDGRHAVWAGTAQGYRWRVLEPGVHVVSNADLDTPWPKCRRLAEAMQRAIGQDIDIDTDLLFTALADTRPAADEELPDTGVGIALERMLSPPFVRSPPYGTRASTVVVVPRASEARFLERRWRPDGSLDGQSRFRFLPRPANHTRT